MRFIGEIQCNVDDKGRVKMPVSFKKHFEAESAVRFMIAKDIEDCLVIYPMATWEKQENMLMKLNDFNPAHRAFKNTITIGLTEIELDSADRFLISKQLMKYLGNAKEVVLKGQFDRIQIWESAKYEAYTAGNINAVEQNAAEVAKYLDSINDLK